MYYYGLGSISTECLLEIRAKLKVVILCNRFAQDFNDWS